LFELFLFGNDINRLCGGYSVVFNEYKELEKFLFFIL